MLLRAPLSLFVVTLLLASPSACLARGWLGAASNYQEAVQAMAAGRFDEALRLIQAASPGEGRVVWVQHLLEQRVRAEETRRVARLRPDPQAQHLRDRAAVSHCYAYHNLYLFLRTEDVAQDLVAEAASRAEATYQEWIPQAGPVDEALRWAFAGLLHEIGRGPEGEDFLARTATGSDWEWSRGGPPASAAERFDLGFQMLLAYYHSARGDAEAALAFLQAAKGQDGSYVRAWATESDDFYRLREDPRFRSMFGLD